MATATSRAAISISSCRRERFSSAASYSSRPKPRSEASPPEQQDQETTSYGPEQGAGRGHDQAVEDTSVQTGGETNVIRS